MKKLKLRSSKIEGKSICIDGDIGKILDGLG